MNALTQDDDPLLTRHVVRTPAGAAPAVKPEGAMNSVFDTGAAAAAPKKRNKLGERSRQLVLNGLQQGEALGGALAKRISLTQPTVSAILRELVAEGLVETNGEPATSKNLCYRLKHKTTTAADGFKAWLAKTGSTSAEGRTPPRKKEPPMQPAEPTVITGHKATHTRRAEARTDPAPAPTWSGALESSGHLVIRANGQELALDASQARGLTAWLIRVDAAMSAALGA